MLEVGVGTGWPIASTLSERGQKVYGVDIASTLIKKCNNVSPKIKAEVCDASALHYDDNMFDVTYSVHFSWFFSDLTKSIAEMCRVTNDQGNILIDIMNVNNPLIKKIYQRHVFENANVLGKTYKTMKNVAKLLLKRGTQDWPFLVSQVPSDPNVIIDILSKFGGSGFKLYGWRGKHLEELTVSDLNSHDDFDRIVVCCRLQKS